MCARSLSWGKAVPRTWGVRSRMGIAPLVGLLLALTSPSAAEGKGRNLVRVRLVEKAHERLASVYRGGERIEAGQASRWLAYALLEVETGFNRLSGWRDLPALARALERPPATSRSDWAATPREFMTTSE